MLNLSKPSYEYFQVHRVSPLARVNPVHHVAECQASMLRRLHESASSVLTLVQAKSSCYPVFNVASQIVMLCCVIARSQMSHCYDHKSLLVVGG